MPNQFPANDAEFVAELQKFIAAVTPDPTVYGLTTTDISDLTALAHDLDGALASENAAQTELRKATAATVATRVTVEGLFREFRAEAYENAADAELVAAGLEPRKKPVKTASTLPAK